MNIERQYRELKKLREKVALAEDGIYSRRSIERESVCLDAYLSIRGHITSEACLVRDLSVRGAGIHLNGLAILPVEFALSFDEFYTTTYACRLVWRHGDLAGVAFLDPPLFGRTARCRPLIES
ncbi:PilZ domain-containing protein [Bradyrhizobium sp. USDA 10063]